MNDSREPAERCDLALLLILGDWSDLGRYVLERAREMEASTRADALEQPIDPHASSDAARPDGGFETFHTQETIWEGSA